MDIEKHLQDICGGDANFLWIDYKDIGFPEEAAKGGHKVCCALKIHNRDTIKHGDTVSYSFAFAFCSPKDAFVKKTGRIEAMRNLYRVMTAKGPDGTLLNDPMTIENTDSMHRDIHANVRGVLKYRQYKVPRWADRTA